MSTPQPNCQTCRERMVRGFVVDSMRNGISAAKWVEGEPQRSFWTGIKLKGLKQHPITAYRCPRCGLLAQYALES